MPAGERTCTRQQGRKNPPQGCFPPNLRHTLRQLTEKAVSLALLWNRLQASSSPSTERPTRPCSTVALRPCGDRRPKKARTTRSSWPTPPCAPPATHATEASTGHAGSTCSLSMPTTCCCPARYAPCSTWHAASSPTSCASASAPSADSPPRTCPPLAPTG